MQAVILAGGKGTRLHPLTTNARKPLVPLFDRPVMEYCIKLLARHGITDIIVAVSHLAQEIMHYFGDGSRFGVKIRYSVEMEPLGTAGAVKQVQSMINDTFVVVAGDIVTDFDLTAALQRHKPPPRLRPSCFTDLTIQAILAWSNTTKPARSHASLKNRSRRRYLPIRSAPASTSSNPRP